MQSVEFWGDANITLSASTELDDSSSIFGTRAGITLLNPIHVGIRVSDYFIEQNKQFSVDLVALNSDERVAENVGAVLEIERQEWKSVQRAGVNGRLEWTWELVKTVVEKRNVTLGKRTLSFQLAKPGFYIARLKSFVRGHQVVSEAAFYITGPGYVPWRVENGFSFNVDCDKGSTSRQHREVRIQNLPTRHAFTIETEDFFEGKQIE
jgi:hypothetical protein